MRNLIINFAIAAVMTGLFTAMVGAQVGMAMSAARDGSDRPLADARAPTGPNHSIPATYDQPAS
jgi:hypothetical protein